MHLFNLCRVRPGAACGCRPTGRNPDVVLAHDQVVLTVALDLGGTVFGEEDFVADFDVEFDLLAIVVELASAEGYGGTFLRFSFAVSGMMMPPFLTSFSSSG